MPLENVIERMRKNIYITPVALTANRDYLPVQISFRYPDPKKTQQVVQTLLVKFQEASILRMHAADAADSRNSAGEIERLEERIAVLEQRLGVPAAAKTRGDGPVSRYAGVVIVVLDPASFPELPAYPGRVPFGWAGLTAGLALAIVIAVFRRRPPPIPFPAQPA